MTLFRGNSSLRCFFCRSTVPFTSNVKNFKCTSCGCRNRYNDKGEILSDEPAMRDEHLNAKSFAKRGSPSKDQLPNLYGPAPFCHSCQTNQMLQINLLSNYLPDPDSPEYSSRLEMLPAYRESLDARYPPVCHTCMPLVEDEIRRKEQMARIQALGGWLSKGKERHRQVSNETKKPLKVINDRTIFWWKLRGCLWALSTAVSLVGNTSAIFELRLLHVFAFLQPVLPFIVVVSLLWAAWDPTYAKLQHAQQQSRYVRVQGKYMYRVLQVLVWISRLLFSSILSILWFYPHNGALLRLSSKKIVFVVMASIEILSLAGSAVVLRIHQPHPVRLVDTSTHNSDRFRSATPLPRSATPVPAPPSKFPVPVPENDLLASLSLSSTPVMLSPHNPVFGHPSLKGSSSAVIKEEISNEDMDWTPTNPVSSSVYIGNTKSVTESENWLRPQRFFAPEKTTGLEGLLQSAQIGVDSMVVDAPEARKDIWPTLMRHLRLWRMTYISLVALIVGLLFALKMSWSQQTKF